MFLDVCLGEPRDRERRDCLTRNRSLPEKWIIAAATAAVAVGRRKGRLI
jgi:hypothetical protein